jgi:hypothetical protein
VRPMLRTADSAPAAVARSMFEETSQGLSLFAPAVREGPVSHASGVWLDSVGRTVRSAAVILAVVVGGCVAVLLTGRHVISAQAGNDKTIYVTALDPLKQPLSGLEANTWAVHEDGKDRPIVASKPATDPLDVVLMIDTSVNAQPSIADLRSGLQAFAKTLFAGTAPVTMSIMDVAAADVMVAENKKVADDVSKTLSKTFADRAGNTVMLEGLVDAAKKLAKSPTPRRAIVLVNIDGVPDTSRTNMSDVVKAVLASNASVWAATYQNNASKSINQNLTGGDPASSGVGNGMVGTGAVGQNLDYFLSHGPEGTGGMRDHLAVPSALTGSLTTIANALVGQYAITY